jgi:sec-independent protein translocase protein TatB
MLNIGTQELLVVLLIALIVVGPSRLPELSRSIGKGLREFRKVQDEVKDMVKLDLDEESKPARPTTPTAPGVHRTSKPVAPRRPGRLDGEDKPGTDEAPAQAEQAGRDPSDGTPAAESPPGESSAPDPESSTQTSSEHGSAG